MRLSRNVFSRLAGRMSVSRKLMLIYALDLTAVIFVSTILINEKFIAIDFARKEVQGNAYIAELRGPMVDAARAAATDAAPSPRLAAGSARLPAAEALHGPGMDSAALSQALGEALRTLAAADATQRPPRAGEALGRARDLVTRIGNQSNLILDPDLDSYYTMSLVVLRFPELLHIVHGIGDLVADRSAAADAAAWRMRYLVLEGRLDAITESIRSDHAEAYAAGGETLRAGLRPREESLAGSIDAFREAARRVVDPDREPRFDAAARLGVRAQQAHVFDQVEAGWATAGGELDRMLRKRIDGHYQRMAVHLGTALALLLAILGIVYLVASQIARPLKHLAGVADEVRRTGDHRLRAHWDSADEIGRLVRAFNDMLAQLDRERELQQELAASARAAEAQRQLVESTPIALMVTSVPGHDVLHANPPAEAWLRGRRRDPWCDGLEPAVRARFFQQLADRGGVDEFEVRWLGGAEPAWAVLSARRVRFQGQDAVLTAFAPINHLKLMERRLELWAKVFQASSEAIVIVDAERRILTANAAFSRHTGYELQDVIGERPELFFGGAQHELPAGLWPAVAKRGAWQGELEMRRRNGSEYPAWLMVNAVRQGKDIGYHIFTSIDITDRKRSEQRIRFLAEHDVLTELPNRSLVTERLRLSMQQAQRSGQRVAVLFIDLDRFKDINDSLGHHIGDGLLRSVARRLVETVRPSDTVSRLGGDEFVVVLNGVPGADEVAQVVQQRLIPRIREPHQVQGAELHVSCSVGIALYPDDAHDLDELMRHADTAMYEAKAEGRDGARFFAAAMTARAQARLRLETRLRGAHEQGQLELHWQPRVNAVSGQPVGVEGLLRWTDDELGPIAPSEFIPIAEETGLIVPIGAQVVEQACAQIAAWRDRGLPPLSVSINISARQLRDPQLVDTVRAAMVRHAVPSGQLELELTESMLMERADAHRGRMAQLRELGVTLSIDDFGTGYSSLAYLTSFPLDKLKIDRSFVRDMLGDANDRAIIKAIIGLGHTLGLRVVAEGVEREAEAALLREAQCDELQGYLFGRPMPAAAFESWWDARCGAARPSVAALAD